MYVYEPLRRRLASDAAPTVQLTYQEMERLLGRPLPPSARGASRRQWWANTESHSQARAWLSAGRRAKPLGTELVEFTKPRSETVDAATPDIVEVRLSDLRAATRRTIDDLVEEKGLSAHQAVAALLDRYALDQRAARLAWFQAQTRASPATGAELIRAERDAR